MFEIPEGYNRIELRIQTNRDELVVVVPFQGDYFVSKALDTVFAAAHLKLEEAGILPR